MSNRDVLRSLVILGIALLAISCSTGGSRDHYSTVQATASPTILAAENLPSPSPTQTPNSPIRSVDFANISYPNFPTYSEDKTKRITLKPGQGGPSHINYGDVTGDGQEEAMVVLPIESHGSAIPYYVYIFTMQKGRLRLIWDFETGDRADGGLRQVYAEGGELVIELYGKDRIVGGQLYRGEEGLCCPGSFTRARYKWTGKEFKLIGKEILANPKGNASVVMPLYAAKSQLGRSR